MDKALIGLKVKTIREHRKYHKPNWLKKSFILIPQSGYIANIKILQ